MNMSASAQAFSAKGKFLLQPLTGQIPIRNAKEFIEVYEGHIVDGTLVLCGGLRIIMHLGIANCTAKNCNSLNPEDFCFYYLNAISGFHSFIK